MSSFKGKTPPFGFDPESHFYELVDSNNYQGKPVLSLCDFTPTPQATYTNATK